MAAISLSSQESESNNKFHHLLRPYRELADDWNIDLAEDLIEYIQRELEEYEEASAVNFAQAAVLVQNSAMVYTKKVESLYDMIIKALEKLSTNQSNTVSGKSERKREAKSAAQDQQDSDDDFDSDDSDDYEEEDDFRVLPIPDVEPFELDMLQPQSGTVVSSTVAPSIQIELLSQVKSQVSMCRSTLIDIRTGALLLESDRTDQSTPSVNLVVVESQSSSNAETLNAEIVNRAMDESFDNGGGDDGPDYYGDDYHPAAGEPSDENQVSSTTIRTDRDGRRVSAPMTWDDFLDPNVPCKVRKDKPFRKGKCYVNPSDERLNRLSLVQDEAKEEDEVDIPQIPLLAMISDPSKIRTTKDVGITGLAFVEFEFIRKMHDRQMRKQGKRALRDEAAEEVEEEKEKEEEAYDEDYEEDEYYGDGNAVKPPTTIGEPNASKAEDFILPESAMNSTSESYADLVRSHVSRFLEDARNWASESKLSLRVRGWHDHLEPILHEQESRPVFDLREYETILVNELQQEQETNIPFETLVDKADVLKMVDEPSWDPMYQMANQPMSLESTKSSKIIPRWQVCRMFLTALELANQGSVEIDDKFGNTCDTEADFENRKSENFKLTYLKPLRFASGKAKKKMMRVSAGGKENQIIDDRENVPIKILI